jgi:hypothetical protein
VDSSVPDYLVGNSDEHDDSNKIVAPRLRDQMSSYRNPHLLRINDLVPANPADDVRGKYHQPALRVRPALQASNKVIPHFVEIGVLRSEKALNVVPDLSCGRMSKVLQSEPNSDYPAVRQERGGRHQVHVTVYSNPSAPLRNKIFAADAVRLFHRSSLSSRSIGRISRSFHGSFHVVGVLYRGLPERAGRPPQGSSETDKRQGFENQPKIMVALNRVYDRPEDDPKYANKVIAGAIFVAACIGLVVFIVGAERRIRRFNPPKPPDENPGDGKDC